MLCDFDSWHRCSWRSINVVPNLSRWIIIFSSNTEASTFCWLCLMDQGLMMSHVVSLFQKKTGVKQFRWNSVKYLRYSFCFSWLVRWFVAPCPTLNKPRVTSVGWATGIWRPSMKRWIQGCPKSRLKVEDFWPFPRLPAKLKFFKLRMYEVVV